MRRELQKKRPMLRKLAESRRRRSSKFNVLENSRSAQLTDKVKLTLSVQSAPSRRESARPARTNAKRLSWPAGKPRILISLVEGNSSRRKS